MRVIIFIAFLAIGTSTLGQATQDGSTMLIGDAKIMLSKWNRLKTELYHRNQICGRLVSLLLKSKLISNSSSTSIKQSLKLTNTIIRESDGFDSTIVSTLYKQYINLENKLLSAFSILKDSSIIINKEVNEFKQKYDRENVKLDMTIQSYNDYCDNDLSKVFGMVKPKNPERF